MNRSLRYRVLQDSKENSWAKAHRVLQSSKENSTKLDVAAQAGKATKLAEVAQEDKATKLDRSYAGGQGEAGRDGAYQKLNTLFARANDKFNAGLFAPDANNSVEALNIEDKVLRDILGSCMSLIATMT